MALRLDNKKRGIICILISAFFFSGMSSFINLSGDVPIVQKVFFRNLVAFFLASATLIKNHEPFKPKKGCLPYHILRSSAAIFLKEKVKLRQAVAIFIAFLGALFVIKPSFANAELLPSIAGFVGGMCAGGAYTCVRHMGNKGENGRFTVFFFSAFSVVVTAPYLFFNYYHMSWYQFFCLIMVGVCAAGGQFGITAAYTFAPSREISVYDYSNIIFTAIEGYLFLGQGFPDTLSLIGYAIICAMAIWMFIYNNRSAKAKGQS